MQNHYKENLRHQELWIIAKNKIRLLEVLINENCPLIDIKLKDLTKKFPKLDANIMGVIRNEKFAVLKKEDVIKKDDKAYIAINASL